MTLTVRVGKEKIQLKDFVAAGGEGNIYIDKGFAYKIYHEKSHVISLAKAQELATIDHPFIIRPLDMVMDGKGMAPLGYRMKEVTQMVPLAKYLNKSFKEKNKVTPDSTVALVRVFQNIIKFIHSHGVLMVDINEANFSLNTILNAIFCLDVDSYQTRHFPATALMDKVKDFHASSFTQLTDWFSFAILSFNIFIGIHPFRGGHPKYDSIQDKAVAMVQRMKDNVSVLHSEARMPPAVLPLSVIPQVYLRWYRAMFEDGKRVEPPVDLQAAIQQVITQKVQVLKGKTLKIEKIQEYLDTILGYTSHMGLEAVVTSKEVKTREHAVLCNEFPAFLVETPRQYIQILVTQDKGQRMLRLTDVLTKKDIPCSLAIEDLMYYKGCLYGKQGTNVFQLEFIEWGIPQVVPTIVGSVSARATQVFDGVIIENLLGRYHAMVFPQERMNYTISLPELDKLRVLDAKYEDKILVVLVDNKGVYNKYYFRLNALHDQYDTWVEKDVDYHNLNFVVLENGIIVEIIADGKISIYTNMHGSTSRKIIEDQVITGDMYLYHNGVKVLFSRGNTLYSIKMG